MAAKIRRDDEVIVLIGKDKGKSGKVKKMCSEKKIIVYGINMVKKKVQNNKKPGSIIETESEIHVSNVAIFNKYTGKADRVGFRLENGKKVRFFKSTSESIT